MKTAPFLDFRKSIMFLINLKKEWINMTHWLTHYQWFCKPWNSEFRPACDPVLPMKKHRQSQITKLTKMKHHLYEASLLWDIYKNRDTNNWHQAIKIDLSKNVSLRTLKVKVTNILLTNWLNNFQIVHEDHENALLNESW